MRGVVPEGAPPPHAMRVAGKRVVTDDIVEVFNAKISDPALNQQATALAARWDRPGGAGSDAHDPAGVGAAYLEMPDFDGPAGFLAALRQARVVGQFTDHAPRYSRSRKAGGG